MASGLCADSQYESGVIRIVDFMARVFKLFDVRNNIIVVSDNNNVKNEWDYE